MASLTWGFGKVLRWLRLKRGLDGEAYAKAMGLPLELLEAIEAGQATVGIDEAEQIATGLKVDAYQLLRMAALQAANPDGEVLLIDLLEPRPDTPH